MYFRGIALFLSIYSRLPYRGCMARNNRERNDISNNFIMVYICTDTHRVCLLFGALNGS